MIALLVGALLGVAPADSAIVPTNREVLPAFLKILKEHRLGPWLASRSPCRAWSVQDFRAESLLVASRAVHDSDCPKGDPGDRFLFTWPGSEVFLVVGERRVPLKSVDSLVARNKDEAILAEERIRSGLGFHLSRLSGGADGLADPGPILVDPYLDDDQAGAILLMGGRLPKDRTVPFERQFEWRSRFWLVDSGVVGIKGKGRLVESLQERIQGRLGTVPSITWPHGKPGSGHLVLKMRLDTTGKADSVKVVRSTPGLEFLREPLLEWARGLNVRQGSIEACWIQIKIAAEARLVRTVPDSLWKPATVELIEKKGGGVEIRPLP